jgi:hypothetical protein
MARSLKEVRMVCAPEGRLSPVSSHRANCAWQDLNAL